MTKILLHRAQTGPGRFWTVSWLFEPRDIWVGLYWKRYPQALDLFICIVPFLPIEVYVEWH